MSFKRARSPSLLTGHPVLKKRLLDSQRTQNIITFDSLSALGLADELVLSIFGYLDAVDLCRVESVNRAWQRLAGDNELWKALFLRAFGRLRLRGARFSFGGIGRAIVPRRGHLPAMARPPNSNWKELYRVGRNWQTGRSVTSMASTFPSQPGNSVHRPSVLLIGRSATIISNGLIETAPQVVISAPQQHVSEVTLTSLKRGSNAPIRVSSLALNQVPSPDASISLAVFYSTSTKFDHLSIFHVTSDLKSSLETSITTPRIPRSSIQHSAYHSDILIALSETFQVDIYHLPTATTSTSTDTIVRVKSGETVSHQKPILICALSSFSSFPPASLRISRPTTSAPHKVLLSYAVPIYPAHWSIATTELLIHPPSSSAAMDITSTRTLRAFHGGWTIENEEETNTNPSTSPSQINTKLPDITALQTDGRHLVVVPANETFMLLYRVRQTSLSFVRVLFGPVEPVCAIAVADARCVGACKDGAVWVWDLEGGAGVGVEVEEPITVGQGEATGVHEDMQVCFDDRRIVVVTPIGLRTISFD